MKRKCWGTEVGCRQGCTDGSETSVQSTNDQYVQTPSIFSVQPPSRSHSTITNQREGATTVATTNDIYDLIARDMDNLSLDEREGVFEDIHGVKQLHETDALVDQCLEKMEKELKKMPKLNNAYNRALFLNRRHVKDRKFELMFLRADEFDPKKAAKRMLCHFETKLELFDHEKLTKHIRYSDLDEETIAMLKDGVSCLFPMMHDSIGRNLHTMAFKTKIKNPLSTAYGRAGWYKFMTTLMQNEQCQQKGIVLVFHTHGASLQDMLENFKFQDLHKWVMEAIPMRIAAIHFCMHTEVVRPLLTTAMHFLKSNERLRMKLHYGSILECQYELNSFGIPTHSLSMDMEGNMRYDAIEGYLNAMKVQDEIKERNDAAIISNWIIEVRETDVLLGKGPQCQWFPGTVALMDTIKKSKPQHVVGDRQSKQTITAEIVKGVKLNGGRFLEQDAETGWWVEVNDKHARVKVAMGFRNLNKKSKQSKALLAPEQVGQVLHNNTVRAA